MPKAKGVAKKAVAAAAAESDSDDEYRWKPSWQEEKKTKARTSGKLSKKPSRPSSQRPSDDDDDGDSGAPPPQSSSAAVDEKEDDDGDKDEWRTSNRTVTAKHRSDPLYIAQADKWKAFRQEFPVPLRQPLSAGVILALRRALKQRKKLVYAGLPIELRRDVWEILSGARAFHEKLEHTNRYAFYLRAHPDPTVAKQIAADAGRALRGHMKFTTKTGQQELSRVLAAFAVRSPAVGYANSTSHVAGFLLLFYPEERAFWMLCTLVDIILPQDYYSQSLLGARADTQLLKILIFQNFPRIHAHLTKHGIDVSTFTLRWLMPLFLTTLPVHVCIRLWDIMMLDGSTFLLSVALALFQLHSKAILAIDEPAELFAYLDRIGHDDSKTVDTEAVIKAALSSKCAITEEDLKRRDTERRIMESAYLTELQATQKYKAQEEERKRREEEERVKQIEDEELNLSYGTEMWKVGKQGKARRTRVYLHNETAHESDRDRRIYTITWDSKSKQPGEARLLLRDCSLFSGLGHGQFSARSDMAKQFAEQSHRAWSVIGAARSLDLVCLTDFDYEEWSNVLRRIPMKAKQLGRSTGGRVAIRADGNSEGDHGGDDKKDKAGTQAPGAGGAAGADTRKGLTSLERAREERRAKEGGPAASKLAALLKNAPPPDDEGLEGLSDDEEQEQAVAKAPAPAVRRR